MKNSDYQNLEDRNSEFQSSEYRKASYFIEGFLKKFSIDKNSPENRIISEWEQLAGKHISSISRCIGVKNKNLMVVCKNSSYSALVKLNRREILKNIQTAFPEIKINKISVIIENKEEN